MKTLLYILALLISACGLAQPQLGMAVNYTVAPSSALSATPGIAYSNTISISCMVINRGTSTFSAGISLMRVVKTGTTTSTARAIYTSSTTTIIPPGDSLIVTGTDSITALAYKVNGNGNTIVVWPISSGAATKDSLFAGPVYVNDPTGIRELDKNQLFIYPNPASQMLFIRAETGKRYKELVIYDMQLKALVQKPFQESTDISALPPGTYIISVKDEDGKVYSSRFVRNN